MTETRAEIVIESVLAKGTSVTQKT